AAPLPNHAAARRVLEKLGFTLERPIVHGGCRYFLYRLTQAQFQRHRERGRTEFGGQSLSSAQVRELDRRAAADYGLTTAVLMENAGRGAAEVLLALGIHGPVVVGCGKGNNGGDGLVTARRLHEAEIEVVVLLFAEPFHLTAEARANWQALESAGVPSLVWPAPGDRDLARELGRAEWFVDALLGVGLTGPPRAPLDRVIAAVNASPARVLAIDIPSGLDADTGEPLGAAIRARHTATFVAPKRGFGNPGAGHWLGKVHVVPIGVPPELVLNVCRETT
ncbi:MAG: NAD(P)H-hydrate epimerase, partial [Gemmataceae bacterium]|nr:NAD(P)H-hydrate epimerase [Gemmataceae bacterium]